MNQVNLKMVICKILLQLQSKFRANGKFLSFLFSLHVAFLSSQEINKKNAAALSNVIKAYNTQDFKLMKKDLFFVAKVFVSKKQLKKEFSPLFKRYGTVKLDSIIELGGNAFSVKTFSEKIPGKRVFFVADLTKHSKIKGFGQGEPLLMYNKVNVKPECDLVEKKLDSLLVRSNYLNTSLLGFNGCILVTDSGNPIYKKCFGLSDIESKSKLNDTTLFELASCSKQFTAYSVLMLYERKLLDLADDVRKYIPELPYKGVTIESLLTHTSGLPDYELLLRKKWDRSRFATNNDVVLLLAKNKPKIYFEPGTQFSYCNTAYVLLSVVIERISKMTYSKFLEENIFIPLNMRNTRVYNTRRTKKEFLPNYAYGYVNNTNLQRPVLPDSMPLILPDKLPEFADVVYQDNITGDGTVNSCLNDLVIWENNFIDNKLLSKETMIMATTTKKLKSGKPINYGYGFFVYDSPRIEKAIYHTGWWPGYLSVIYRFENTGRSFVVLSNTSYTYFNSLTDNIALIVNGN